MREEVKRSIERTLPIAVFDSGLGGITILEKLIRDLPHENFIYFADTARSPLGDKSPEAIIDYMSENVRFLMRQNIKLLVVACHTACSYALRMIEQTLPVPIFGVMAPGLSDLLAATQSKRVGLLATSATIAAKSFQKPLETLQVYPIACPLFVPLIEGGLKNSAHVASVVERTLAPLFKANIDAALLACTHYPLLSSVIKKTLGSQVQLIDPANSTTREIGFFLKNEHLLNPQKKTSEIRFFVSGDPEKFRCLAEMFFPFLSDLFREYIHLKSL